MLSPARQEATSEEPIQKNKRFHASSVSAPDPQSPSPSIFLAILPALPQLGKQLRGARSLARRGHCPSSPLVETDSDIGSSSAKSRGA